jgi:hypothetical protein
LGRIGIEVPAQMSALFLIDGEEIDRITQGVAAAENGSIQKDWFVDWLWGELQAEFGFRPPR